jgi:hypothetical protein
MLTIESSPHDVIALRFTDVVERADIEALKKTVGMKLQSRERLGLLLDMSQWSDITADAILEHARSELAGLADLARFGRMAFVSDKQFIWAAAGILNALVGTTEVRSFAAASHAQALAFVSAVQPPAPQPLQRVVRIDTGHPSLLGYRIAGTLKPGDVELLREASRAVAALGNRIGLLLDVTDYKGLDPAVLAAEGLAVTEAIRGIHRYAVIGAEGWMLQLFKLVAAVVPGEVRHFEAGEESSALHWLRS